MTDRSKIIFGNTIGSSAVRKAEKSKAKYEKKFGDDSNENYPAKLVANACLNKPLGVYDIRIDEGRGEIPFDLKKGLIVGNIRMGFGHYRISIAMAIRSPASALTSARFPTTRR